MYYVLVLVLFPARCHYLNECMQCDLLCVVWVNDAPSNDDDVGQRTNLLSPEESCVLYSGISIICRQFTTRRTYEQSAK